MKKIIFFIILFFFSLLYAQSKPEAFDDDIKIYKDNATLGVGKLDYLIASGIKQKNIQDQLGLEQFLHLDQITPMQTSYTQTADDREVSTKETDDSGTAQSTSVDKLD